MGNSPTYVLDKKGSVHDSCVLHEMLEGQNADFPQPPTFESKLKFALTVIHL